MWRRVGRGGAAGRGEGSLSNARQWLQPTRIRLRCVFRGASKVCAVGPPFTHCLLFLAAVWPLLCWRCCYCCCCCCFAAAALPLLRCATVSCAAADAMVGWVAGGRVHVTDRFLFSQKQDGSGLRLDRRQDWVAVGGEESVNATTGETWTTIHFWRYLDTGDCNDRPIVSGHLSQVIWSFGEWEQSTCPASKRCQSGWGSGKDEESTCPCCTFFTELYHSHVLFGHLRPTTQLSQSCGFVVAHLPPVLPAM